MLIVYDFEVFRHDWLVVFKYDDQEECIINNRASLMEFYETHKRDAFVGFNNSRYDDYIFRAILTGLNPYFVSRWIINDNKPGYSYPNIGRYNFVSLDLSTDVVGAVGISLKQIEANMGLSIVESPISFDINRNLTQEELDDVLKYCKHDVAATQRLLEERADYIKSKFWLIKEFKLSLSDLTKTTNMMTAKILDAQTRNFSDEYIYDMPDFVKIDKYREVLDLYKSPIDYDKTLTLSIAGVEHKLAYGGLHGARPNYINSVGDIWLFDVSSYYPSMIVEYGFGSRRCKNIRKYDDIYHQRMLMKKQGKVESDYLKNVLNAMTGAMKFAGNPMYDPKQNNQICITGQLLLIDLIEKLEPYCTLIQSNTDGIIIDIKPGCRQAVGDATVEWEKRTRLSLSATQIVQIAQKDVNNYVFKSDRGKIKAIGGYLKNWKGATWTHANYSIIHTALVNALLSGDVDEITKTIVSCNDPLQFQTVVKLTGKFDHLALVNEVGQETKRLQNVVRVFACGYTSEKIMKIREDGRQISAGNLPDNCMICNEDLSSADVMKDLNKQWYIKKALEMYDDYLGRR